uniref:WD_REPEATS_REGION domain-containing protein n=1 Tax=Heterorhabditis bacteriophora TaxID=37862 RepID=A0A1I7W7E1_HETBA
MHCEFMADGNYVMSSSNGFNGDGCEVSVCALTFSGKLNFVNKYFGKIFSIWDVRTKKLLRELRGHEGSVTCVIFLNQQISWKKLLLSVSTDRTVRIWNAEDGNCLWVEDIPYDMDLLQCVAFNDAQVTLLYMDVEDGRIIEGFSNDALGLTTVLLATGILLLFNNFYRRAIEGNHVHPELAVDIQGFRELFIRPNNAQNNVQADRLVAARAHADRMCPICYGNASFPILTNCGHVFCLLLPLDWPTDDSEDDDSIRHNNIGLDDYNRRFSGDRPVKTFQNHYFIHWYIINYTFSI